MLLAKLDRGEQLEAPEHNSERRRFIVWALMLGATTPAVVSELIVADCESTSP